MSDTRRSMFKKLAGAAAALVGIKAAPGKFVVQSTAVDYWPPILKTVQFFPSTSLVKWFAADAERLQNQIDMVGRTPSRFSGLMVKEPLPEGMGYNWSTVDKPES